MCDIHKKSSPCFPARIKVAGLRQQTELFAWQRELPLVMPCIVQGNAKKLPALAAKINRGRGGFSSFHPTFLFRSHGEAFSAGFRGVHYPCLRLRQWRADIAAAGHVRYIRGGCRPKCSQQRRPCGARGRPSRPGAADLRHACRDSSPTCVTRSPRAACGGKAALLARSLRPGRCSRISSSRNRTRQGAVRGRGNHSPAPGFTI